MRRLTIVAAGVALLLAACGAQPKRHPGHAATPTTPTTASTATQPTTTTASTPASAPRRHRHRHHPDPGRLPQTAQLPSSSSRQFHREMAALWRGITHDRMSLALPAFFPKAAYVQLKAIAGAQADWQYRLLGGYSADIGAAHVLLGSGATSARLVSVQVPAGYAHWVSPNVCYNRVGYWETPNSRLIYTQGGQERSFGIASMISWRGVWYVVHLGGIIRTGAGGMVDDPSTGAGYAAPSSTC